MLLLVEEANEYGMKSLSDLEEQDEKLDRIEDQLMSIGDEMDAVKKDINSMQHFCASCILRCQFWRNRCAGRASTSESDAEAGSSSWLSCTKDNKNVISEQPRIAVGKKKSSSPEADYIPRITNNAKEDEMDANLRSVDSLLENLKGIAIDINTELNLQQPKIDRIDQLVVSNDVAMGSNSKQLSKLSSKT